MRYDEFELRGHEGIERGVKAFASLMIPRFHPRMRKENFRYTPASPSLMKGL